MCMWFEIFVTFSLCELCHFLTSDFMKVYRQWVPCKRNSLYNFIPFFMQLCISFFHGLKMCMWSGFNPAVNFCHFSTLLTLSFFNFSQVRHQLHRSSIYISTLWTLSPFDLRFYDDVYRQLVLCERNSLYNFIPFFMQLCTSFFHGLKMCMWFGFNPTVNFCHFSTLLPLSFFNFSQVRHQFDLYLLTTVLLLRFVIIVIVRPLSVILWLFVYLLRIATWWPSTGKSWPLGFSLVLFYVLYAVLIVSSPDPKAHGCTHSIRIPPSSVVRLPSTF